MSHSSGIPVTQELKDAFGSALEHRNTRLIKAIIDNEQIVPVQTSPTSSNTWEQDLDLVPKLLEVDKACYILYRLDTEGPSGYNWALFCYVPDKCKVKDKMIYASTRSNLKQQLGMSYFSDEVFGTVPADFSKQGYEQYRIHKKTEAPLTEQENIKLQERAMGEVYSGGQSTYVHGVAFPVLQEAIDAMKQLVSGSVNYVQIAIDCDNEKIKLDHTKRINSFSDFGNEVPINEPRFHFYAYDHEYEGSNQTSYVYIFSCPDGSKGTKSAPVRMRMLYSSSKASVGDIITTVGGSIGAKFEINSPDDLTEETVFDTLHPKKEEKAQTFSKPSRPGKGGARLVKKT